jgi:hypothetical protein
MGGCSEYPIAGKLAHDELHTRDRGVRNTRAFSDTGEGVRERTIWGSVNRGRVYAGSDINRGSGGFDVSDNLL